MQMSKMVKKIVYRRCKVFDFDNIAALLQFFDDSICFAMLVLKV